jgi:asparagine synthase (glutamine-hydrolysing)
MCGIFGVIRRGGLRDEDLLQMARVAGLLHHRGPDGEGVHLDHDALIGMRRLSIIDLHGGWQPLYSEDRQIVVVANGEVYNFIELRAELEGRGHVFATGSDCEVIVHLYEEFGDAFVQRLRGMYAFAILDRSRRRVVLGRDRLGEKPLIIHRGSDRIVFSSELRSLVLAGVVPDDLDPDAIADYMHWGFVNEPRCAVRGLEKLLPASILTVDLDSWIMRSERYWRLSDAPPIDGDPVERIRHEIDEVGRLIVRSDVPIGVALSSGIDSSAMSALAVRESRQPVSAFTIGYDGMTWQDERAAAGRFARRLGMRFLDAQLGVNQVVRMFPAVCADRDDPLSDITGPGYAALMDLCADHGVRVLLNGMGGDELFWGYPWHRAAVDAANRKRALREGRVGLGSYLRMNAPPLSLTWGVQWALDCGGLLEGVHAWRRDRSTSKDRLVFWDAAQSRDFRHAEHRLRAMAGPMLEQGWADPSAVFTGPELWGDLSTSYTQILCDTYLLCNGLVIMDRQGMRRSIETRTPLVDYRLAEVVVGLRKRQDDRHLGGKHWLKAALADLVPSEVRSMRKRGFTPPWRAWAKAIFSAHGERMERGELVSRGVLSRKASSALRKGVDLLGRPIPLSYAALALEMWCASLRDPIVATTPSDSERARVATWRSGGGARPVPGEAAP